MDFKITTPVVDAESVPISTTEPHNKPTTTDLDEPIDTKFETAHVEFIFGNGANAAAIAPTNGKDHKNHENDAEDSGPETDVDALDEAGAQVSPIEDFISEFVHKNGDEMRSNVVLQHTEEHFEKSESLEELGEEKKNDDYHNADEEELVGVSEKSKNPFFDEDEEVIADKFDSIHATGQMINDNKFLDTVHEDTGFQANEPEELVESVRKAIDFSEKKEFSFEREEFEKEVDSLADVQSAMQEAFGDADAQQNEASSVHSDVEIVSPIPMDSSAEDEGIEINAVGDDEASAGVPFVGIGESLTVDDLQALAVDDEEDDEQLFVSQSQHIQFEEHISFIAPETEHGKLDMILKILFGFALFLRLIFS